MEPYNNMCLAGFVWTEAGEDIPCRTKIIGQHHFLITKS